MTDLHTEISDFPPHLQEFGQLYLKDVVTTWKIIRQRNIDNAHREERIEHAVVTAFKVASKQITDHEKFTNCLDSLVPSITSQISDLNDQLTTLFDDMTEIEEKRNLVIEMKNEKLLSQHEMKKKTEYTTIQSKLKHEAALHEKWVTSQRNKQVLKAIEQYKVDMEKKYEEQLKNMIISQNATILPPPSILDQTPLGNQSSSTTTSSSSSAISNPTHNFSPSQFNTFNFSSQPQNTQNHQQLNNPQQSTSILNSNLTTPGFSTHTSRQSFDQNSEMDTGYRFDTAMDETNSQRSHLSQHEAELEIQKKRQTAIDILEMYANETQFDDEYIQ